MNSLPETLVRFRSDLEEAIGREQASRKAGRARRLTLGVAFATVAGAAIALGLLSALPGNGPSVVERASAALNPRGNTILHTKIAIRWSLKDGSVESSVLEEWQQRRRPYAHRVIRGAVEARRTRRVETASRGFDDATYTSSLYDPSTNTIYIRGPRGPGALRSAPRFCAIEGVATRRQLQTCAYPFFAPGPRPGTVRVTSLTRLNDQPPFRYRVAHRIVSTNEARRISASLGTTGPIPEYHRQRILDLLKQKDAVVDGRVRIAGRHAIRLVWNPGRSVYLVDADTYDPIRFRTTTDRGTQTIRFLVYETLAVNARTRALLSLRAQHPGARVNRDSRAFRAASLRLFPHG